MIERAGYGIKNETTATLMAFCFTLIGISGMGHMYVGAIGRAIVIMLSQWIIAAAGFILLTTGASLSAAASLSKNSSGAIGGVMALLGVVFLAGAFIFWIWQIFDARATCRRHNFEVMNGYYNPYQPPQWPPRAPGGM
jgi:hypothetical protein